MLYKFGPDGKATMIEYDSAHPNVQAFRRDDPSLYGPLVEQLMADARPTADMSGNDKKD